MTLLELGVAMAIIAALAAVLVSNLDGVVESIEPTATQTSLTEIRDGFIRYWRDVKHAGPIRAAVQASLSNRGALQDFVQPRVLLENPDLDRDGERFDLQPFDPATQIGWRGPYITASMLRYREGGELVEDESNPLLTPNWGEAGDPYGQAGDITVRDHFRQEHPGYPTQPGRPIIIQAVPVVVGSSLVRIDVRVISAGEDGVLQIPVEDEMGQPLTNETLVSQPAGSSFRGDDLYVAFEVRP